MTASEMGPQCLVGQAGSSWAFTGAGWGEGMGTRVPSPTTEPSVMPPSYAIIFALRPISTWEQCKLFKTRFSGLAIIIMMISISVAIASDYLAGNFAAWGQGSSREPTRIVRSEGFGERKEETEWERESLHSQSINCETRDIYHPISQGDGS